MELKVDGRRAPLFLLLNQVLKIVVFFRREWQHFELESHIRQELLIVDSRRSEFNRMNLNAPPSWRASVDVSSLDIWSRIKENTSQRD
jgi:hypothetical protein